MNESLIPSFKRYSDGSVKYGYVDKNNNVVIPYIYEFALPFTCGLAGVRNYKTHLVGFINKRGEKIVDFQYDYVHPFNAGKSWTCRNGMWGLIDKTGEIIIPFKYLKTNGIKNGLSIVQNTDSKWGVINLGDEVVLPFNYNWLLSEDNSVFRALVRDKWIDIDRNGNTITGKVLKLKK